MYVYFKNASLDDMLLIFAPVVLSPLHALFCCSGASRTNRAMSVVIVKDAGDLKTSQDSHSLVTHGWTRRVCRTIETPAFRTLFLGGREIVRWALVTRFARSISADNDDVRFLPPASLPSYIRKALDDYCGDGEMLRFLLHSPHSPES